jgi:hypothetical protein
MVKCIRGFMTAKRPITSAAAIKQFRKNAERAGVVVRAILFCVHVGDNVWAITSNVEIEAE